MQGVLLLFWATERRARHLHLSMRHADVRMAAGEETPWKVHRLADAHADIADDLVGWQYGGSEPAAGFPAFPGHWQAVVAAFDGERLSQLAGSRA